MTSFVLIPGAGGEAWYWHRVTPLLQAAGHDVIAVDLPGDDDQAGWQEYADTAVAAAEARRDQGVVVVGQSMGGFTAPLVAARLAAARIVLLNAMIPVPGETGGDWWTRTGQGEAQRDLDRREGRDPDAVFDPRVVFFHDVPDEVTEVGLAGGREQSGTPFGQPWPLPQWPAIPTHMLAGRDDRLFPPDFQRRVARERLGLEVELLPGGHLLALSYPEELAAALVTAPTLAVTTSAMANPSTGVSR